MQRSAALIVSIGLLLLPGVAPARAEDKKIDPDQIGNRDVGKGLNLYSLEKEISLGKGMAAQLERDAPIVRDPEIAEYVNRIGQNLSRNSDVKVPVVVKVLNSAQVNAFALPGGFVYVNTGVLLKANEEAELAGVIAHELGHVAGRHGTRQASRGQVVNWASLPLIFMGGWAGYAARQAAGLVVPMTFLKYSRDFEREADLLGLQYLAKAGYDPTAMVAFFERIETMEKTKPGTAAEFFRSHPVISERIKKTQKNIDDLLAAQPQYIVTTSQFRDVKEKLELAERTSKLKANSDSGPTLRRRPADAIPAEGGAEAGGKTDDDERPTLRRRPGSEP